MIEQPVNATYPVYGNTIEIDLMRARIYLSNNALTILYALNKRVVTLQANIIGRKFKER